MYLYIKRDFLSRAGTNARTRENRKCARTWRRCSFLVRTLDSRRESNRTRRHCRRRQERAADPLPFLPLPSSYFAYAIAPDPFVLLFLLTREQARAFTPQPAGSLQRGFFTRRGSRSSSARAGLTFAAGLCTRASGRTRIHMLPYRSEISRDQDPERLHEIKISLLVCMSTKTAEEIRSQNCCEEMRGPPVPTNSTRSRT